MDENKIDPKVKKFEDYVERRRVEGASEKEMEKLYDDLNDLKMNSYIGSLLEND